MIQGCHYRFQLMDIHTPPSIRIESREQLLAWLGEAAEIEHNLMCCYLYAMFSLKHGAADGLDSEETTAVERWRHAIRGVALEEMTHLTLVSNLASAIGGSSHFMRPNFPVPAGAYPASLVIELAPFDMATLDHFIFVERPESEQISDGAGFSASHQYSRHAPSGRLMPYASDYSTVGELYRSIRAGIDILCREIGEKNLFCGDSRNQIGPQDSSLPGLCLINDQACANRALDIIVSQGEGSWGGVDSHFERFRAIRREYQTLLTTHPDFSPSWPVARNPVMRKPPQPQGRIWITEPLAARYVDTANALYVETMRLLTQIYAHIHTPVQKRALVQASHLLMRALTPIGQSLARLPANPEHPGVHAGMSFATIRSLSVLGIGRAQWLLIDERMSQLIRGVTELRARDKTLDDALDCLTRARDQLSDALRPAFERSNASAGSANQAMQAQTVPSLTLSDSAKAAMNNTIPSEPIADLPSGDGIEQAHGQALSLSFEAKRCIHARHCVLSQPRVFKANTPGEWIFPDQAQAERLAATILNCPSGALRFVRQDDGCEETAPEVNTLHVRENGPLAIRAETIIDGKAEGYRLTLCRCGQSMNKPYCDGSHSAAGFVASGEPIQADTQALASRDGLLEISPQKNGPLEVTGNLELCSGTGRVFHRADYVRLCRCGQSRNKPFCDGSHSGTGFVADGV